MGPTAIPARDRLRAPPRGRRPVSGPPSALNMPAPASAPKSPGAQLDSGNCGMSEQSDLADCHSDVTSRYVRSALWRVHQFDNALQIVHRAALDHDLALALAQAHRDAGVERTGELLGHILEAGHVDRLASRRRRLARVPWGCGFGPPLRGPPP